MCKCDNWHDILIWINFGLSIDMIVFGVFAFLGCFIGLLGSAFFLALLFPIYYV